MIVFDWYVPKEYILSGSHAGISSLMNSIAQSIERIVVRGVNTVDGPTPPEERDGVALAKAVEIFDAIFVDEHRTFMLVGDQGSGVFGGFDEEWMPRFGIEPFELGEFYVAGDIDPDCYPLQNFTRSEICSWMHLAVDCVIEYQPHLEGALRDVERRFYIPEDHDGVIARKMSGQVEWDCEFPKFSRA